MPLGHHTAGGLLAHNKGAGEDNVQDPAEGVYIGIQEDIMVGDSGVVDQDVDPAEGVHRGLYHPLHLSRIGDVGG